MRGTWQTTDGGGGLVLAAIAAAVLIGSGAASAIARALVVILIAADVCYRVGRSLPHGKAGDVGEDQRARDDRVRHPFMRGGPVRLSLLRSWQREADAEARSRLPGTTYGRHAPGHPAQLALPVAATRAHAALGVDQDRRGGHRSTRSDAHPAHRPAGGHVRRSGPPACS